MNNLKPA